MISEMNVASLIYSGGTRWFGTWCRTRVGTRDGTRDGTMRSIRSGTTGS